MRVAPGRLDDPVRWVTKEIVYPIGARRQMNHATVGGCDISNSLNGVTAIFYPSDLHQVEYGRLPRGLRQIHLSGTVACVRRKS